MSVENVERFFKRLKSIYRFSRISLFDLSFLYSSKLPFSASKQKTPIVFGLPSLVNFDSEEKKVLVSSLHQCLDSSKFDYSREGSIGGTNLLSADPLDTV